MRISAGLALKNVPCRYVQLKAELEEFEESSRTLEAEQEGETVVQDKVQGEVRRAPTLRGFIFAQLTAQLKEARGRAETAARELEFARVRAWRCGGGSRLQDKHQAQLREHFDTNTKLQEQLDSALALNRTVRGWLPWCP